MMSCTKGGERIKTGLIRGGGVRLCVLGIPQKYKDTPAIGMLYRLGITDKDKGKDKDKYKDTPAIRMLYLYRWLHIGVGWMLITLVVAGFTGLVRKEE
jgi:hypothetical protein